ncbi:MAG: hypothetical protein ACOYW3_04755, partial [Bacteroidota bacterium]
MKTPILLVLLCSLSFPVLAQSKYEKSLIKAEAYYTTGEYSKAVKTLEKFKKKVNKKLGAQNKYTPTYYLSLAKYDLGMGMVLDFETHLQSAISSSTQIQPNSKEHIALLIS